MKPGLQMHLKLPSSLMHMPLRHMLVVAHSSWSVREGNVTEQDKACGSQLSTQWSLRQSESIDLWHVQLMCLRRIRSDSQFAENHRYVSITTT